MLETVPGHRQRSRIHRISERDFIPCKFGGWERHLDLRAEVRALEKAAIALDASHAGELDNAARRISAAFDLSAVAVPDAHAEIGGVAWLQNDELIAADAGAA